MVSLSDPSFDSRPKEKEFALGGLEIMDTLFEHAL
jgi:hypothetical protein